MPVATPTRPAARKSPRGAKAAAAASAAPASAATATACCRWTRSRCTPPSTCRAGPTWCTRSRSWSRATRPRRARNQPREDNYGQPVDFAQLRLQLTPMIGQHLQELVELRHRVTRTVVHLDDVLGFVERQAQSFGSQGQSQAGTVTRAVDALTATRPGALRLQQAHVFVKTNRARGQIELLSQIADRVGGRHDDKLTFT